ncbi:MAG: ABC transporter permease [Limisphaerales bacterium]
MTMLGLLFAKDLRRAVRNPARWLVHLAVPLVITGLLGAAFGGANRGGPPGRIKLALVDEDGSAVTGFLRGALNQGRAGEFFEPQFLSRSNALAELTANRLAAAVVIPAGFTDALLDGRGPATLEVIKNPAQQFHPAIVEEMAAALVTGLDAAARNFGDELAAWRRLFADERSPTPAEIARLVERTGERLQGLGTSLFPPRVWYEEQTTAAAEARPANFNLFAFLLPGLASMFLLFLADQALRDLFREQQAHTLARFATLRPGAGLMVASKVVFALVLVLLGAAILLGGGALLFGIAWARPAELGAVTLAYALAAAGVGAALAALAGSERRAEVLNTAVVMGLGLAGGSAFPSNALPAFLRDNVTPLLPNAWFIEAVRALQFGGDASWTLAAAKLAGLGAVLIAFAAWRLGRQLETGGRP